MEDFRRTSPMRDPGGDMEILVGSTYHAPGGLVLRDRPEPSSAHHFLSARGEAFPRKLPSRKEEWPSSSPSQQRRKASSDARQCLAEDRPCRGFCRGHRSLTPSRKCLRAKGFHHGRASEDAGGGALTTSLRSSVAGATLAFTMPLVPPALCCFLLVLSHLLWAMSSTALAICSPDSGCLRLLPASGFVDGSSLLGSGG
jgi:hypothetical protein